MSNIDNTEQLVLDVFKKYNLQPGHIFPVMQISIQLSKSGISSDDVSDALASMVQKGWLLPNDGPLWKITQDGYDQLGTHLSDDEVERAILDVIKSYNVGPGEIFPVAQVSLKLPSVGHDRVNDALEAMVDKGLLERGRGPLWKITATGHALL
jgi:hypothetical protein